MTVENTKIINVSLVEQVLTTLTTSVLAASDLSSLDHSVKSSLESLLKNVKGEDSVRQVSSASYVENCLALVEDLQKTIFANALAYTDSSYALGQKEIARRVPQIFFTHPKLSQSQIEDLAIETENVICNRLTDCPIELEEIVLNDYDGWDNDLDDVLETYLVPQYLGSLLRRLGQPVYALSSGFVWGRTCSGQAVEMDCTIQQALALGNRWLDLSDLEDDEDDEDDEDESEDDEDYEDDEDELED